MLIGTYNANEHNVHLRHDTGLQSGSSLGYRHGRDKSSNS